MERRKPLWHRLFMMMRGRESAPPPDSTIQQVEDQLLGLFEPQEIAELTPEERYDLTTLDAAMLDEEPLYESNSQARSEREIDIRCRLYDRYRQEQLNDPQPPALDPYSTTTGILNQKGGP
jgi:hypothetical protein